MIVVGGGIAGLSCARVLAAAGRSALVLERADGVGGRVRTDDVDGFLLDRGFQVLPLAYPEPRRLLDLERLRLCELERGAIVRVDGRFRRVVDPRRDRLGALRMAAAGVVGLRDGPAVLRLLGRRREETTTLEALRSAGVSRRLTESFLAPFLRGIFLDARLSTSSRFLEFVLDTFGTAAAALPARGMGQIPRLLAEGLEVRLRAEVVTVGPGAAALATGEQLRARAVVVAAAGLVAEAPDGWNAVSCLYYDAPQAPLPGSWLVLNGEGGPVNNLCVTSEVSPELAPAGRALVSVTVLGAAAPDERSVRRQLRAWFGAAAAGWRHLRTYTIPQALPAFPVGGGVEQPPRLAPRLYACGDHRGHPSLNGAMASGRRAAEAVLADLR